LFIAPGRRGWNESSCRFTTKEGRDEDVIGGEGGDWRRWQRWQGGDKELAAAIRTMVMATTEAINWRALLIIIVDAIINVSLRGRDRRQLGKKAENRGGGAERSK
jgi:hypothetical protein